MFNRISLIALLCLFPLTQVFAGPETITVSGIHENDRVRIADFNGDGRGDLLIANLDRKKFCIYLQQADGSFTQGLTTYAQHHDGCLADLFVADFDGDHKMDIVAVYENRFISFFRGTGDGDVRREGEYEIPFSVTLRPALFDVDRDGKKDILIATEGAHQNKLPFFVFHANGKGDFPFSMRYHVIDFDPILTQHGVREEVLEVEELRAGFFNGDGTPDLAILDLRHNRLFTVLGTSDGEYAVQSLGNLPKKPYTINVLYANDDNRHDILVASMFPKDTIYSYLYLTGSNGNLGTYQRIPTGAQAIGAAAGYFLSPHRRHLAVSSYILDKIILFAVDANGVVADEPECVFSTGELPHGLAEGDLDGDGLADLATPNCSKNSNSVTIVLSGGREN